MIFSQYDLLQMMAAGFGLGVIAGTIAGIYAGVYAVRRMFILRIENKLSPFERERIAVLLLKVFEQ